MIPNLESNFKATMHTDGVHVMIDGELALIVDNDPDDLVMRIPSDGYSHPAPLLFSIDDAIQELFGSLNRQQKLGMTAVLSVCIFAAFEAQDRFANTVSQ